MGEEDQLGDRFYSGVGCQVQVKRLAETLAPDPQACLRRARLATFRVVRLC